MGVLSFIAELVLITSATRTVTLNRVAVFYCWGGTIMGVMWLISGVFTSIVPEPDAVSRQFFVPVHGGIAEDRACRIHALARAQVAHLDYGSQRHDVAGSSQWRRLWTGRRGLLSFSHGPTRALDLFPLTRINGATLTVGHASFTGLAGATLGLALLWRPRKP